VRGEPHSKGEMATEMPLGHLRQFRCVRVLRHTGLILDNRVIVRSSGEVRRDEVSTDGIYNRELGRLSCGMDCIKSVL
jgi:hypothetical protein